MARHGTVHAHELGEKKMVDFRYHLVSLISVFVALAIGIILGAGPLQTPIANSLSGQVKTIREEQAAISAQVETARIDIAQRNEWVQNVTEAVLPQTFTGIDVAIVASEDARPEDIESISNLVTTAGGKVNQQATLTPGWHNGELSQYRSSLSGAMATHLSEKPAADAPPSQILASSLVDALTKDGDEALLLRQMLNDESNPLVTFHQEPAKSQAIVIIGGPTPEVPATAATPTPTATQLGEDDSTMWSELARAAAKAPKSAVVVGAATTADELVSVVRTAQIPVTTIDGVGTSMSNASTVLALTTAKAEARAYGFASGATAVVPPLPASVK